MAFRNPFNIKPEKATVEDAMVALYGILHMHEKADGEPLHLPLADATFAMDTFVDGAVDLTGPRCGTAACAAGSAALSPWFHKLAESRGISTTYDDFNETSSFILDTFVDDPEIWGDAYEDMEALFYGDYPAYEEDMELETLSVNEVKAALRKIVFKHFGQTGLDRCYEMDKRNCLVIK